MLEIIRLDGLSQICISKKCCNIYKGSPVPVFLFSFFFYVTEETDTMLVLVQYTRHIWKVSTIRLLKKIKIYFPNMLFLPDSPNVKLPFYIVSTIIKAFIITGHQILYPLLVEHGHL
jgi:hypothetical protein